MTGQDTSPTAFKLVQASGGKVENVEQMGYPQRLFCISYSRLDVQLDALPDDLVKLTKTAFDELDSNFVLPLESASWGPIAACLQADLGGATMGFPLDSQHHEKEEQVERVVNCIRTLSEEGKAGRAHGQRGERDGGGAVESELYEGSWAGLSCLTL